MDFDHDRRLNRPIPEVRQRRTQRDTLLYGLGVSLGNGRAMARPRMKALFSSLRRSHA